MVWGDHRPVAGCGHIAVILFTADVDQLVFYYGDLRLAHLHQRYKGIPCILVVKPQGIPTALAGYILQIGGGQAIGTVKKADAYHRIAGGLGIGPGQPKTK